MAPKSKIVQRKAGRLVVIGSKNTTKNEAGAPLGCIQAQFGQLPACRKSNRENPKLKTASASGSRYPRFYTRLFWD